MNTFALRTLAISAGALLTASALAQSSNSATPAAHRRTTTAVHRRTTTCVEKTPPTPAGLPPVKGCAQTEYALRYIDIRQGSGEAAPDHGWFTVNYTGWLAKDGTKFDSSYDRNEAATFPVGMHHIIPGWETGFDGMKAGGKRRLFIPWQLAYGTRGAGGGKIPPKSDLIFDIELIAFSDKPPAPKTPPAATKPPAAPTAGAAAQPSSNGAAPASAAPASPATPAPAKNAPAPSASAPATPPAGSTPPAGADSQK